MELYFCLTLIFSYILSDITFAQKKIWISQKIFRKKSNKNITFTPCIGQTLHFTPYRKMRFKPNIAQILHWLDISGDWWPQAELVDRSLLAYTPAPSNPSFMGAFVQWNWNGCLFSGEASSLDAFSSYPQRRGCPATALSDNRLTRGHSVPFLSY